MAPALWSAPSFSNVAFNTPVERLDKFEVSFDLSGTTFGNAYDPAQIDVSATFTTPGGLTKTVNGFYMRNYSRSCSPTENLSGGTWKWMARYSPEATGAWSVTLRAVDSGSGTTTYGPLAFSCVSSARRGLVRVSTADNRYLEYEDGSQFIPVGQNMGWSSTASYYSCDFDDWMPKVAAQGGNILRWWFTTFNTAVEWNDYGSHSQLGNYAPLADQQWRADYIIERARGLDLQVCVVLLNMGDLRASGFENKWFMNVYNAAKGGPCANPQDFFTNTSARDYFKRRLRYTVARWGYASNLIWEMWNELDFVDNYNDAAVNAWHTEMGSYLKAQDLNRHLLTDSFSDPASEEPAIWANSLIDFTGFHRYSPSNTMEDEHLATLIAHRAAYNKPFLGGEIGIQGGSSVAADPSGVHFHNSAWGGLLSGAAGTPLFWDWDTYIETLDLYTHYRGMANFSAALDYRNSGFVFSLPGCTTAAYKDFTVNPLHTDWGTPAASNSFTVSEAGFMTPPASDLSVYLHNPGAGSRRNPPTFNVNYQAAGTFAFRVQDQSGSNTIRVTIDGGQVFNQSVSNGSTYTMPVSAGSHAIFIDNTAGDWIEVGSFTFGGYTPALKTYALVGPSVAAGWVVNRDFNFDYVRVNGNPAAITGTLHFTGISNGIWNVEWWDTLTGVVTSTTTASAVGGLLDLAVPSTSKDRAFKLTLSGVAPTATPTLTSTPQLTATPSRTSSGTPSPTPSATVTPLVCGPTYSFDSGTAQGWYYDTAFDTAFTAMASTTTLPDSGTHSLEISAAFVGGGPAEGGLTGINAPGFPKDLSGRTLTARVYVPAGMSDNSLPSGAFLYVKTGLAWNWNAASWMNLPPTAGWVNLSFYLGGIAAANVVQEIGIKIALGSGAPDWSGTIFVDSVDEGAPSCSSPTPTPTPPISPSSTPTATPSSTSSETASATPGDTPVPPGSTETATPTASPSFSASPSASPTATPTPALSATGTPMATPSPSPPPSPTQTPLPASPSPSHTPGGAGSATFTPSVSATFTPTITSNATGTPAATLTPQGSVTPVDYGAVTDSLPAYNPQWGSQVKLWVVLNGKADGLEVKLFTPAYALAGSSRIFGLWTPGRHTVSFDTGNLSNGTYYYQVRAVNGGRPAGLPKTGKLVILN